MKRVLIFCISVFLVACSAKGASKLSAWARPNGKVKVLCTTEMVADLVRSVGGDRVDCLTLMTGEIDPHSYELVKGDGEKFQFASVVFASGLNLEHGTSVMAQLDQHANAVRLGDLLPKDRLLVVDGQYDPHIWMDISLWKETVPFIVATLSSVDGEGEQGYAERGRVLMGQLEEEDKAIEAVLKKVPAKDRFIVTTHDAFHYFTRRYLAEQGELSGANWMERCKAPEGLAPDSQMSVHDIMDVSSHLVKHSVPVVFAESNLSTDALKKIIEVCGEKGHVVSIAKQPLYGDSMGTKTYIEMMRSNAETIAAGLRGAL